MTYRYALAAVAVACLLSNPAFAKGDKAFLGDALKGDNSEVALGQLAAKMGASEGVKTFGSTLATDHGMAKTEVATLATTMKVPVTDKIKPEARKELEKLNKLSGPAFDKEFASYMVKDHEKDIAEFKEKAAEGNTPVAMLAAKQLPTLQKHLEMAQSLSGM
jgi:putative membrane protein